ncbi:MAG: hypothetical protein Q9216_005677 [Gyalolechia sp. 2 TL-2023]
MKADVCNYSGSPARSQRNELRNRQFKTSGFKQGILVVAPPGFMDKDRSLRVVLWSG